MFLSKYKRILKELELDYEFKKREIEYKLLEVTKEVNEQIVSLREQCAKDTAAYEHDYHYAIQTKQAELAKLDALIEARRETSKNDAVTYKTIVDSKNEEIKRLTTIIKELTSRVGMADNNTVINK